MVRQRKTIERKLKQINAELYRLFEKSHQVSFWQRWKLQRKIDELNAKSWALAWALNKVDHDKRGDHAKKN